MIHIVDGQTNRILDYIPLGDFWDDVHRKSLKNTLETFDFTTFADKRYSQHLSKRNRIIIPDEDGSLIEFIIENTRKYRSASGALFIDVYTVASYLELKKSAVIKPQKIENQTASTVTGIALNGTEWRPGIIEGEGTRTFSVDTYTDPYSFAKVIATEFGLERRYRVEHDGNKITNRYLDLLIRIGAWQGREIEFGTDLLGIERKEDTSNIVTALLGLGPEKEDGTRLEVLVTDNDALQRWGRRNPQTGELMHIIETYEPQFTNQEPTEQRLRELTQNELEKRVNSIVEYTTDIVDLETVPGLENKKIRFGDTLKIKDTYFNPPLYLEARVHTQERSLSDKSKKKVTLGDYIEYTEEEVMAIWKSLKAEIAKKVSLTEVMEVTYTKTEIDDKDAGVYQDSTQYADTKKDEAIQVAAEDATNKANLAEQAASAYADSLKQQTDQQINDVEQSLSDLDTYVDGTFKDNVIQEAEAKAIEKYLNQLNAEKADIDAKYNDVYNNPSLSGTVKTNLSSKKSAYNTAHTNLINAINTAISDGKTTPSEKSDVDTKFSNYHTALSQLSTAFEDAIDAIAQTKAQQAENNAKEHADMVAGEAESNAKAYALSEADKARIAAIQAAATDAQTKVNAAKTALEASIAEKADAQWVNGQLVLKENAITKSSTAPSSPTTGQLWLDTSTTPNVLKRWTGSAWVKATPTSAGEVGAYTKTEVDNALNSKVSTTTYTTDKAGIVNRLDNAESRITQTEKDITSKVSQTTFTQELGKKENSVIKSNTAPTSPTTNQLWLDTSVTPNILKRWSGTAWVKATPTTAAEVGAYTKSETDTKLSGKADTSAVTALETRMSTAETGIQQTASAIALKANKTDVYTKTETDNKFTSVNQQISQLDAELSVQADQIASKVSRTEFESLQVGGRNYLPNSKAERQVTAYALFLPLDKENKHELAGEQVVVSFEARHDNNSLPVTPHVYYRTSDGYNMGFSYGENKRTTTEYQRFVIPIDEDKIPSDMTDYVILAIRKNDDSNTIYIRNVKLEKGNRATDWTPAPEDLQGQIDGLGTRVSSAETSIVQLSDQIQLKANKTDVYTKTEADNKVTTAVNNAKSEIKLTTDSISQSVSSLQGTVNSQGTRLSSAESSITSLSSQIQSKVSQTTFESALSGKENTVYKQNTAPAHANGRLWLDTSKTPNILYRSTGTAWVKATPTTAAEVGAYSQTDGTALAGRLSTAESTITQQADLISQKVSKTDYNGNTIASLINQTAEEVSISAQKIALDGYVEAKHIKSLNGLNVGNGQFVVDANGNVKFAGNLEGASGTFGQVTVKDGDFYLKDSQSDIQYSLTRKRNLIKDHSFELVKVGDPASQDNYDHWWLPMTASTINWKKIGDPRVVPIGINGPGVFSAIPIFGNRAILVNSTNYVEQAVWDIAPNTKYTFSVFAKRAYNSTVGAVRLEVHYIKTNVDGTTSRATLAAQSFGNVNANYAPSRHSVTFTTPSQNVMNDYNIIFVIKSTNSNWVQCDGVQVVEGEYPTIYDMEESMWTFLNGRDGYQSNVIDYGWNSNGHYVRFGDGTQICYAHHTITAPNANGSWEYNLEKDFPAAFVDAWNVGLSVMGFTDYHGYDAEDGRGTPMVAGNTVSPTRYRAVLHMNAHVPSGRVHFFITAIGRWK